MTKPPPWWGASVSGQQPGKLIFEALDPGAQFVELFAGRPLVGRKHCGGVAGDEHPGTLSTHKDAFGFQLTDCPDDGRSGYAKVAFESGS